MCPLMGGREQRKPVNGLLQTPPVSFFLADPVINYSCEYKYVLSPESLSCESLNMWGLLKQMGSPSVPLGGHFLISFF